MPNMFILQPIKEIIVKIQHVWEPLRDEKPLSREEMHLYTEEAGIRDRRENPQAYYRAVSRILDFYVFVLRAYILIKPQSARGPLLQQVISNAQSLSELENVLIDFIQTGRVGNEINFSRTLKGNLRKVIAEQFFPGFLQSWQNFLVPRSKSKDNIRKFLKIPVSNAQAIPEAGHLSFSPQAIKH